MSCPLRCLTFTFFIADASPSLSLLSHFCPLCCWCLALTLALFNTDALPLPLLSSLSCFYPLYLLMPHPHPHPLYCLTFTLFVVSLSPSLLLLPCSCPLCCWCLTFFVAVVSLTSLSHPCFLYCCCLIFSHFIVVASLSPLPSLLLLLSSHTGCLLVTLVNRGIVLVIKGMVLMIVFHWACWATVPFLITTGAKGLPENARPTEHWLKKHVVYWNQAIASAELTSKAWWPLGAHFGYKRWPGKQGSWFWKMHIQLDLKKENREEG